MIPPVATMAAMIAVIMIISMAGPGYRICPKFVLFFGQKRASLLKNGIAFLTGLQQTPADNPA